MTDNATLESICANDPSIRDCAARISGGRGPTAIRVHSDVKGLTEGVAHSILQPDFHRSYSTSAEIAQRQSDTAQSAIELTRAIYPGGLIYPVNSDSQTYPVNAPADRRLVLSFGSREAGGARENYIAGYWTHSKGDSIDFPQNNLTPVFLRMDGGRTPSAEEIRQIVQQDSTSINTWLAQHMQAQAVTPPPVPARGQQR